MPERAISLTEPQSAAAVLMVRPARFGFNSQTAPSNSFQHLPLAGPPSELQQLALREFEGLADRLRRAGVGVIVADDTPVPVKPDALFPNNWVSFHRDGTVVLYPMLAPNRRSERRDDVIRQVSGEGGFRVTRTVDLSYREDQGKYLEGTGSMVLDRVGHVAYASLSPRTDLDVLGEFAQQLDYELVTFEALDGSGNAIYHTNVLMAIGARFAVVCGAAIPQQRHRDAVYSMLRTSGREIIEISAAQMLEFAGNLLELAPAGTRVIALSTTAWRSLDPGQRRALESHGGIVAADIPVIERCGGGGVRCMLAEIHLPTRV
ncbi:MAG: citrulline utilization hydrolase CtlX [Steroidobacteraceae bacterium]